MASTSRRGTSWRVLWRNGGRTGTAESTTWPDETLAMKAKTIAEAHGHAIAGSEVYAAILGTPVHIRETPTDRPPTLREWSETWLRTKTRITSGTKETYRRQFSREILPVLGDKRLDEITGVDVSDLLVKLQGKFANATVTRYYAPLFACLAFAVREGKIGENPAERSDFVRDLIADEGTDDEDSDEHVYLTPAEYALIVANLAADAVPLVEFLAGTGARFSEATAVQLRAARLDLTPPDVRVVQAWKRRGGDLGEGEQRWYVGKTKGSKKKGGQRRDVPVGVRLVNVLRPLGRDRPGDAWMFTAPEGGPVRYDNFRWRRWEPAVSAAMRCAEHPPLRADGTPDRGRLAVSTCDCPGRLKRRPKLHDLRHSHVAWLIAQGRPILVISRRIGHHSITVTERVYAGILPSEDEATAAAVDAALDFGAGPGGSVRGSAGPAGAPG